MSNKTETTNKPTKLIFGKGKDVEWKEIKAISEGMDKLTSGSNILPILKKMKKLTDKHL